MRTLIALASIKSCHLHQLDVNNAFLNGYLDEDVYMSVSQGLTSPKPNQLFKLLKYLHGLRQESRKWYEKPTLFLVNQGYKQFGSYHSLFTLHDDSYFTALIVYVDDIIVVGNSVNEINRIKTTLRAEFKINDLGKLEYFLGIEVAHSKTEISICQSKYCLNFRKDTCLLGSKPVKNLIDPSVKLH